MSTLPIHTIDRDARDAAIYSMFGLTAPGGAAIREPDGRLMVWATIEDSQDDDGRRAIYRSEKPITEAEWEIVRTLAWIDAFEEV